jgi:hypothetical protein
MGLQAVVCLMLGVLACIYRKDHHYERRNYIAVSSYSLQTSLLNAEENRLTQAALQNPKKSVTSKTVIGLAPKIVSKVSGQISYKG